MLTQLVPELPPPSAVVCRVLVDVIDSDVLAFVWGSADDQSASISCVAATATARGCSLQCEPATASEHMSVETSHDSHPIWSRGTVVTAMDRLSSDSDEHLVWESAFNPRFHTLFLLLGNTDILEAEHGWLLLSPQDSCHLLKTVQETHGTDVPRYNRYMFSTGSKSPSQFQYCDPPCHRVTTRILRL